MSVVSDCLTLPFVVLGFIFLGLYCFLYTLLFSPFVLLYYLLSLLRPELFPKRPAFVNCCLTLVDKKTTGGVTELENV